MIRRSVRFAAAACAAAAIVVLSGCGLGPQPVVTVLPTDGAAAPSSTPAPSSSVVPVPPTAVPTPSSDAADAVDCAGGPVVLDAGSASLTIRGECPDVQVNGTGLQIDASQADIARLTASGERIVLVLGRVGEATLRGNDIRATATEITAFTVQGDRNTLTASDSVGSVSFRGNDNGVRAASVGPVSDEGDRNSVT
jgi:hypothetical protein